jgi:dGTPase
MTELAAGLRDFLFANVYRNFRVTRQWHKAKRVVEELFAAFEADPAQLPPAAQRRVPVDGLSRAVCDYLAGLSDREAIQEHRRLLDIGAPG